MDIITLDFETFYSTEYSLRRMTTEEYIRDSRFEVIGVALSLDKGDPVWISGSHETIAKRLQSLPWHEIGLVAQNTMFDAAILNWHFDIRPKALFDTMSMARPLVGPGVSVSLANLAKMFLGKEKGDEVIHAQGKRRADFSREELVRYAQYCKLDVELTRDLFFKFVSMGFPMSEMKIIDIALRMFTEPVLKLDSEQLQAHMDTLIKIKEDHLVSVAKALGRKDLEVGILLGDGESLKKLQELLRSNNKFAELLEDYGVTPPTKISPTTGEETYAFAKTDAGFQALAEHPDPRVQVLQAARIGVRSTIEESRTIRFQEMAPRGPFPIPLNYYGAHTGRFSGADKINLQNLTSRGKHAGQLKKAIKPFDPDYVILDGDSSQIEARTLALVANQQDLVQNFRDKEDVYSLMASEIYGRPIDRKRVEIDEEGNEFLPDDVEGFVGKTAILSGGYGAGALSFQSMLRVLGGLEVPLEESQHMINVYRAKYPQIPRLWRDAGRAIVAMHKGQSMELGVGGLLKVSPDGILLPNGLSIKYPKLHQRKNDDGRYEWVYMRRNQPIKVYGGLCVENICQALARIIVTEQMLRISRRYRVALTVHDSIVCIAHKDEAEEAKAFMEKCMRTPPKWAPDLPLDCEVKIGLNYGECN